MLETTANPVSSSDFDSESNIAAIDLNPASVSDSDSNLILGIEQISTSVISMLSHPNVESPANCDAAVMWRNDRTAFKKKNQTNRAKISRRMLKTVNKNFAQNSFLFIF